MVVDHSTLRKPCVPFLCHSSFRFLPPEDQCSAGFCAVIATMGTRTTKKSQSSYYRANDQTANPWGFYGRNWQTLNFSNVLPHLLPECFDIDLVGTWVNTNVQLRSTVSLWKKNCFTYWSYSKSFNLRDFLEKSSEIVYEFGNQTFTLCIRLNYAVHTFISYHC